MSKPDALHAGAASPEAVSVLPYNPRWRDEFVRTGRMLREALGDVAIRIDHIGSTAVPGLAAKDVIDIQIAVVALDEPSMAEALERVGFEQVPGITHDHEPISADEPQEEWRKLFFRERPPQRRINIHVRVDGAANATYALVFRDYLREHPAAAAAYAEVKHRLAAVDPRLSLAAYTTLKDPVCDLIVAAAHAWAREADWRPRATDA